LADQNAGQGHLRVRGENTQISSHEPRSLRCIDMNYQGFRLLNPKSGTIPTEKLALQRFRNILPVTLRIRIYSAALFRSTQIKYQLEDR
jgi:hypothetical protein